MNMLSAIARILRAAILRAFAGAKTTPPVLRSKLNGRRGYGDNDIPPPGS